MSTENGELRRRLGLKHAVKVRKNDRFSKSDRALLNNMTEFLLVMMHYVTLVVFCIGALTALVDAFQIYVKMNNQEGDVSKSILKLFGACVFLLIATYVLPGFFGIVRSDNVMFSW